jgi:hypothetical protein
MVTMSDHINLIGGRLKSRSRYIIMIIVVTLKIISNASAHVHVVSMLANVQASTIVEALPFFKWMAVALRSAT